MRQGLKPFNPFTLTYLYAVVYLICEDDYIVRESETMDYYYETERLQKCIADVRDSMLKAYDREDLTDKVARSVIESFAARLRCEISYQGFHGLLVSEEQIWEKVQDREVGKMLDEEAEVYEGPLTEAFRKGLEGKE